MAHRKGKVIIRRKKPPKSPDTKVSDKMSLHSDFDRFCLSSAANQRSSSQGSANVIYFAMIGVIIMLRIPVQVKLELQIHYLLR